MASISETSAPRPKTKTLNASGLRCDQSCRRRKTGTDASTEQVERFSDKPLSDGLSADLSGNVFITDVEHGSVMRVGQDRVLRTLVRSERIRWADALSFGPDGWLYVADSALPEQMLRSEKHIRPRLRTTSTVCDPERWAFQATDLGWRPCAVSPAVFSLLIREYPLGTSSKLCQHGPNPKRAESGPGNADQSRGGK